MRIQRYLTLGRILALVTLAGWVATVGTVNGRGLPYVIGGSILAIGVLGSWITSIVLWTGLEGRGGWHVLSLAILILVGFLVGWLFILFRFGDWQHEHRGKEPPESSRI